MFPPLNEIKRRRKLLGITQADLSKKSGVSQSLVAKIESGKTEPSYSFAKRIFETLDALEAKSGTVARDIMNSHVASVQKQDTVSHAIAVMKKFNVSQLPVMTGEMLSGSISEKSVLDRLAGGESDVSSRKTESIMGEPYPAVSEMTPFSAVIALLQHNQAIMVVKKERVAGIITKADIFKVLKTQR